MNTSDAAKLIRTALSKAGSSIRIEGEVIHRENGTIALRRGGSVFEIEAKDVIEEQQMEGSVLAVIVKADAQLIRSSVLTTAWFGNSIGFRPVFDDCTECCECTSECLGECSDCSVCISDCVDCSFCTLNDTPTGVNTGSSLRSSWIRALSAGRAANLMRLARRRTT
jgi:hypothetical protein